MGDHARVAVSCAAGLSRPILLCGSLQALIIAGLDVSSRRRWFFYHGFYYKVRYGGGVEIFRIIINQRVVS